MKFDDSCLPTFMKWKQISCFPLLRETAIIKRLVKNLPTRQKNHGESNAGIFQPVGAKPSESRHCQDSATFSQARASVPCRRDARASSENFRSNKRFLCIVLKIELWLDIHTGNRTVVIATSYL